MFGIEKIKVSYCILRYRRDDHITAYQITALRYAGHLLHEY